MPKKLPPGHGVGAHKDKMGKVMHEFKRGQLHSGTGKKGKKGPIVKNRDQAIAIGISESKHAEQLMAMGYSEEAALAVASFVESQRAGNYASEGPLSDVDSTPGKQKGNSGRNEQPQQGKVAVFPTSKQQPSAPGANQDYVDSNVGSTACPPKKTDAEKQAEKAARGNQPTQPTKPPEQAAQQPAPQVKSVEQAAEAERKKQQREACKKAQGN